MILFGPVFGVILGLLANYAAKGDNEVGEAARGLGKTALELLNYLNKVGADGFKNASDLRRHTYLVGQPAAAAR